MPEEVVAPYKEEERQEQIDYTDKENDYRGFLIERLEQAKEQRDEDHIEFDNKDYDKNYDSNYKAGNAYLRPKKNREDSRIVTGTTLEKENTFLASILNYNFEPNIEVFDKEDLPLMGLGEKIESLVKKSRLIEMYEDKRPLYLKEGADQGTWFVEDTWVENWDIQKTVNKHDFSKVTVKDIKWDTIKKKKIIGCESKLIPGTGVYLGNIREFFMEKQPYIFTHDIITYQEAEAIYGGYDRFEFVSKYLIQDIRTEGSEVRDWTLEAMDKGFVEVIKYQDKWANEYMIILNGVMMLPVEFPLTEISPSGEYTLVKGDIEPISKFFAYSKSYPAKTKVDQEILDDTIRTMVLRLRQMQAPPMANNSGAVISRKIFYPGKITNNLNPNQLQPILKDNQISAGEFSVFQMIKQIVDEKTSNPIMSGDSPDSKRSATEIMQTKQQSMMKMGYAIYGILSFERRLTWLRTYNLLWHWTKKIDSSVDDVKKELVDIYRKVSVKESDEYGEFTRVIEFTDKNKTPEQLEGESQIMSTPGNQIQVVNLNRKMVREGLLKWKFYIDITPTPKDTTELESKLFEESIGAAKMLFGPESTNDEYLKKRWAVMRKEDPEKYWAQEQPQMPGMEGMPGGAPAGEAIKQSMPTPQKPSINQMATQ